MTLSLRHAVAAACILIILLTGPEELAFAEAVLPTTILQLSDLHFCVDTTPSALRFGDRIGDARVFTSELLPLLVPEGVIVTGDLTDAKLESGGGAQRLPEWQAYRSFLDNVRAVAGVQALLDVRGNHDTFDVGRRGGAGDLYPGHGAGDSNDGRVQTRYLHARGSPNTSCPSVVLLGLDFAPETGLRSPSNFAGIAHEAVVREIRRSSGAWSAETLADRCGATDWAPLVVSFGHYPLTTVTTRSAPWPLGRFAALTSPFASPRGILAELMRLGVDVYLSGHLHAAFGQRLHALHAVPGAEPPRRFADLETAAWKDDRRFRLVAVDGGHLSFLDLFFHTPQSPPMPKRPDALATLDPAWQEAFRTRGWGVTGMDVSASTRHAIVAVTYPADARYAPLRHNARPAFAPGTIRARVYLLDAVTGDVTVTASLQCPGDRGAPTAVSLSPIEHGASPRTYQGRLSALRGTCEGADWAWLQVRARHGAFSPWTDSSPKQRVRLVGPELAIAPFEEPLPLGTSRLESFTLRTDFIALMNWLFVAAWAGIFVGLLAIPRLLATQTGLKRAVVHSALFAPRPNGPPDSSSLDRARGAARSATGCLLWPAAALVLFASDARAWSVALLYAVYLQLGPWAAGRFLRAAPPGVLLPGGVALFVPSGPAGASLYSLATPDPYYVTGFSTLVGVIPFLLWVACVAGSRQLGREYARLPAADPPDRNPDPDSDPDPDRNPDHGPAAERATQRKSGNASSLRQRSRSGSGSSASDSEVETGRRKATSLEGPILRRVTRQFTVPQLVAWLALTGINAYGLYLRMPQFMGASCLLFSPGVAWLPVLAMWLALWAPEGRNCSRAT